MILTPTICEQATRLAHEAVLTMGVGNPDDPGARNAQEHRRQIREALLLAIADHPEGEEQRVAENWAELMGPDA